MQQHYEDTYRRDTVSRLNRLIEAGKYVVVEPNAGLPLPLVDGLPDEVRRNLSYEAYGIYTVRSLLPAEPQQPLRMINVIAQPGGKLLADLGNEQSVSLKTVWKEGEAAYNVLAAINQELSGDLALACVATRLEWDDETDYQAPYPMRLRNDHASVACASALWDEDNKQLVAVTLVSSEQQSLRAIYATLVTNSKKTLSLDTSRGTVYLQGARRGYKTVSGGLQALGAEGHVNSLVHPLAGNPQENAGDWFYVICRRGESQADLHLRFIERLQLAIPWPVRPEWAGYLYDNGPVKTLEQSGPDFFGCLVRKSAVDWEQIIHEGVTDGYLKVAC